MHVLEGKNDWLIKTGVEIKDWELGISLYVDDVVIAETGKM